MCQLLILQPSWVGSTPSACHQGPHCPPSFLLPHPLTIWTKPPFNNKKPDYEAKDRKENKGHNEKGGKSLPNVALAAQDSTDRRTQLPHTTSLPATCSSCLCAIFLPLMSESLPLPKTQATLSPLPLQKGIFQLFPFLCLIAPDLMSGMDTSDWPRQVQAPLL